MSRSRGGTYALTGVVSFLVLCVVVGACSYASSVEAPRRGYAAVCQTGGWIEGDSGTCDVDGSPVIPSGSGKNNIGWANTLVEFPAQQRFWRTGGQGRASDRPPYDLPASTGGNVSVDTSSRFTLDTSEEGLLRLYTGFGTRGFGDGPTAADDPDQWWADFLSTQVDPIIERATREEVAKYSCAEMNPSCDLTKLNRDLDKLAKEQSTPAGNSNQGRVANQKLVEVSTAVTRRLTLDGDNDGQEDDGPLKGLLAQELRGDYFNNYTFTINKVTPPAALLNQINEANAALARVVKANADARAELARANGTAAARRAEAGGLRALARARRAGGKIAAQIEMARALCGEEVVPGENGGDDQVIAKGCANLSVLGGGSSNLLIQPGG